MYSDSLIKVLQGLQMLAYPSLSFFRGKSDVATMQLIFLVLIKLGMKRWKKSC